MVRDSEDKTPAEEETSSYLVRYMESLSLEGHCSSRTTCHGGASKSDGRRYTKIIASRPRSSLSASPAFEAKNNKDIDKDITKHIGASSVPRPRAVLSSPDNDEIIGNLNELNRKRETVTVLELQNHKNHAQAASKITAKQNQFNQKGVTLSKTRPLGQNKHAQVKVSPTAVSLITPQRTREIAFEDCKNTNLADKPASDLTLKLRPTIRSRTIDITLEGCRNNYLVEKPVSDLTPKLRPTIRSKTRDITLGGRRNNNLMEKPDSDLTPKLRPSIRSRMRDITLEGHRNNNLMEKPVSDLTPKLRPSIRSRTRYITLGGRRNNNLMEKPASDLTPKLRPNIRSRTREITIEGCRNNNLVEKPSSDLTPKLAETTIWRHQS